jgi:CheY-like chemotaxis protein
MRLNALLMSRDQAALRTLVAGLDRLQIEEEVCASAPAAMELLALGYYSALVVDFDLPGAAQVAHMARLCPAQRRPVVFAMINAYTGIASSYQAGANFVLYKPPAPEQVRRSLRAGRAFMRPDRRRSARLGTAAMVYLRFADVGPLPALVLEVNEDGIAVQAAEPLPALDTPLRFLLPGMAHLIEGAGEVIWADDTGRAGIFFSDMKAESRRQLKAWLGKRGHKRRFASSGVQTSGQGRHGSDFERQTSDLRLRNAALGTRT